MKQLLPKLNFDAAQFDDAAKGLFIPFGLLIGELNMKAYLYIPCSKDFWQSYVYALKEEMKKDGN